MSLRMSRSSFVNGRVRFAGVFSIPRSVLTFCIRMTYGIDQGRMQFAVLIGAFAHAIARALTTGAAMPNAPMINLFVPWLTWTWTALGDPGGVAVNVPAASSQMPFCTKSTVTRSYSAVLRDAMDLALSSVNVS